MAPITVGLVGAGGIAGAHLPAWLELGVDVVVHSIDGAAAALVARHGGGTVVDSLDELLSRCDVVDVCTPTFTHRDIVERAAAAGRDVVCEKPLALTVDDSVAMVAACERAGVQLYPAHVVRFFPEYEVMHSAVADGLLGSIAVQRFQRIGTAPDAGWFHDDELSGGIVTDQMIHDLDFARWNAGPVASVHAVRSPVHPTGAVTAQVVLTHVSGAISTVNGVWSSAPVSFRTRFEVAGDDGLLRHDSAENPIVQIDGGARSDDDGFRPDVAFGESPYLTELREFLVAFTGGPPPRVSAIDGVEAVRIAAAARRSLASHDVVTLEDAR